MTRLLTIAEAANQVGISVQLLKRQIAEGNGPAVTRLGSGHSRILVQPEALDDWIKRRTILSGAAIKSAAPTLSQPGCQS